MNIMTRLKTSCANVKKKLLKMHHCATFLFDKIVKNVGWLFCARLTIGSFLRQAGLDLFLEGL